MRGSRVSILSDLTSESRSSDTTSIGAFSSEKGVLSSESSPISLSEAFPLPRCSVLRFDLGEKSTRVPSAAIPQALKYKGQKLVMARSRRELTPKFGPSNFRNQKQVYGLRQSRHLAEILE